MKMKLALLLCMTVAVAMPKFRKGAECGWTPIEPKVMNSKSRAGPTSLIWDGEPAIKHSWQWHVFVRTSNPFNLTQSAICGGSIIDEHHVLTAAHCFELLPGTKYVSKPTEFVRVYFGAHNIKDKNEQNKMDRPDQLIIHSMYDGKNMPYDIALLVFKQPILPGNNVQAMCLPKTDAQINTRTFIAGWGRTEKGPTKGPLRQSMQVIGNHKSCANAVKEWYSRSDLKETKEKLLRYTKRGMLCAIRQGRPLSNSCTGDSGGGLVSQSKGGAWVVHGLLSFGSHMGLKNVQKVKKDAHECDILVPVYTNVRHHIKWITDNLKNYKKNIKG